MGRMCAIHEIVCTDIRPELSTLFKYIHACMMSMSSRNFSLYMWWWSLHSTFPLVSCVHYIKVLFLITNSHFSIPFANKQSHIGLFPCFVYKVWFVVDEVEWVVVHVVIRLDWLAVTSQTS